MTTTQTGGLGDRAAPYRRTVALVVASTLVLTAAFFGGVAFLEGSTPGFGARIPWYFVAGGGTFVATIFLLETRTGDGSRILFTAIVAAVTGILVLVLGIEGVVFAIRNPGQVLLSRLVPYFLAAGLLATGFGYWTLNHWREFVAE